MNDRIVPDKRQMTLALSDTEMGVLDGIANQKGLSKTAVIRQALRLYQMLDSRMAAGERLIFEDDRQQKKAEVMVL